MLTRLPSSRVTGPLARPLCPFLLGCVLTLAHTAAAHGGSLWATYDGPTKEVPFNANLWDIFSPTPSNGGNKGSDQILVTWDETSDDDHFKLRLEGDEVINAASHLLNFVYRDDAGQNLWSAHFRLSLVETTWEWNAPVADRIDVTGLFVDHLIGPHEGEDGGNRIVVADSSVNGSNPSHDLIGNVVTVGTGGTMHGSHGDAVLTRLQGRKTFAQGILGPDFNSELAGWSFKVAATHSGVPEITHSGVPEIDPAGLATAISLVMGTCGVWERRVRRGIAPPAATPA